MRVPSYVYKEEGQASAISLSNNFFVYHYSHVSCVANVYTFTAYIEMHKIYYKVQISYKKNPEFRIKNASIKNESEYNKFKKIYNYCEERGNPFGSTKIIFGSEFYNRIKKLVFCSNARRRKRQSYKNSIAGQRGIIQ